MSVVQPETNAVLAGDESPKGLPRNGSWSTVSTASQWTSGGDTLMSTHSVVAADDATSLVEEVALVEPTAAEHRRDIAIGALGSACLYGCVRLLVPTDGDAEDYVDLAHSIYTSSVAVYGSTQMRPHALYTKELPPQLLDGRGPVVRMFKYSLGYFAADAVLIAVSVLGRGKYPDMWQGRLVHHAVQFGGNFPAIFYADRAHNAAYRSGLCAAYCAEISSIFLRLSNMNRGASLRTRRLINWSLALSFLGSRVVNFLLAFKMVLQSRSVFVNERQYKIVVPLMAACYTMNLGWFAKITKIAINTK